MSIENITDNILKDAQNNADETLKNAENNAAEIINNANIKADKIKKAAMEKSLKDAENIKNRKVSAAELESRKMMLQAKQDAIKLSFGKVLEKLKLMPESKYIKYLSDEILKIPNPEGMIILNKEDKEKIGVKLLELINKNFNSDRFKLSDETVNSSGGFVLKNGNIEINSTFEAILDSMKDELTNEVANILFK